MHFPQILNILKGNINLTYQFLPSKGIDIDFSRIFFYRPVATSIALGAQFDQERAALRPADTGRVLTTLSEIPGRTLTPLDNYNFLCSMDNLHLLASLSV